MGIQIINPVTGGSIDLTAPPTNIGTTTPPAITVSTLFRSANSGNVPFVAQPSGTGAFQLQPTDSTVTGGNARGANAVDLQTSRTLAAQVASGANSFAAGINSAATGNNSFALGNAALASGTSAFALGVASQSSGSSSFSCGSSTIASGASSVAMGISSSATGQASICVGYGGSTKGVESLFVLGSAILAVAKNQLNHLVLGVQTTNATPTVLRSNVSAAAATNQLVLQNNSALYVEGLVIANVTGAGDTSSWKIAATIKRGANAASTVLVGSPTVTMVHQDAGASTWIVAVTADTTNGTLAVTVTGQADTTIRWTCTLFASEVAF